MTILNKIGYSIEYLWLTELLLMEKTKQTTNADGEKCDCFQSYHQKDYEYFSSFFSMFWLKLFW